MSDYQPPKGQDVELNVKLDYYPPLGNQVGLGVCPQFYHAPLGNEVSLNIDFVGYEPPLGNRVALNIFSPCGEPPVEKEPIEVFPEVIGSGTFVEGDLSLLVNFMPLAHDGGEVNADLSATYSFESGLASGGTILNVTFATYPPVLFETATGSGSTVEPITLVANPNFVDVGISSGAYADGELQTAPSEELQSDISSGGETEVTLSTTYSLESNVSSGIGVDATLATDATLEVNVTTGAGASAEITVPPPPLLESNLGSGAGVLGYLKTLVSVVFPTTHIGLGYFVDVAFAGDANYYKEWDLDIRGCCEPLPLSFANPQVIDLSWQEADDEIYSGTRAIIQSTLSTSVAFEVNIGSGVNTSSSIVETQDTIASGSTVLATLHADMDVMLCEGNFAPNPLEFDVELAAPEYVCDVNMLSIASGGVCEASLSVSQVFNCRIGSGATVIPDLLPDPALSVDIRSGAYVRAEEHFSCSISAGSATTGLLNYEQGLFFSGASVLGELVTKERGARGIELVAENDCMFNQYVGDGAISNKAIENVPFIHIIKAKCS